MKYGTTLCNNFFEFVSIIALLISYILFFVQACINKAFLNEKTRRIKAEKLLYEHFSEEVYSNIKRNPISNIIKSEAFNSSNNNLFLYLEVKLDAYFDCRGIKNGLLNEKICQDKIISNLTCCKSECCKRSFNKSIDEEIITCTNYSFDANKLHLDDESLTYNYDESLDDPRRRLCTYYNKYFGSSSKVFNYNLQTEKFKYNYEELLLGQHNDSVYVGQEPPSENGYIDCGELDTLKNHLFVRHMGCPINYVVRSGSDIYFDSLYSSSLPILVRNIISEIPPSIHEWRSGNSSSDPPQNEDPITIKDINELIKNNSDYYKRQNAYFYIDELTELDINYEKHKVNSLQRLSWYSTNYIGFKNKEALEIFNDIFNENDPTDNPLYKIRNKIYPSVGSIIFGILLIISCCIYIVLLFKRRNMKIIFYIKNIVCLVTFIIGLILYLVFTKKEFRAIDINMDERYKEILDLYNKRRRLDYFLAAIIIMAIVVAFEIYFTFFANKNNTEKSDDQKSNKTDVENTAYIKKKNIDVKEPLSSGRQIIGTSLNSKVINPIKVSVHPMNDVIN
jgi:hypothetical protein